MKKSTWIIGGSATLAIAALLGWAFAPRPLEVEVASVTEGPFETSIEEDGKTRLRDRYVVSAPLAGRLPRITLREGDTVEAGALLATLTPVLPAMLDERTRREQQLRVEIAQAQTQRVAARVEGAKVALAQARNEQQRSEQLARQGFVAPTKLETDRLSVMAAQKDLDARRRGRPHRRPRGRAGARRAAGAHQPRRRARLRAARAGGRACAQGRAGQRGRGGAGHPHPGAGRHGAARDRRRAAHRRCAARAAGQPGAHRALGRRRGAAGPRAARRTRRLHQGVGARRGGAACARADRPEQPARAVARARRRFPRRRAHRHAFAGQGGQGAGQRRVPGARGRGWAAWRCSRSTAGAPGG